jgi:hypothetical protein
VSAHTLAFLAAALLLGFIAGTAITSVVGWVFRDRIKARMVRKRRRDGA